MTRFIHDQFAKQYLSELLSPLGKVETSKTIHSEAREIDLLFIPSSQMQQRNNLGLLGRLTKTTTLFEPFRNPVTATDVRTCAMKLFALVAEAEREAKRNKRSLKEEQLPQLWLLTPTVSASFRQRFHFLPSTDHEETGIYTSGTGWKTFLIAIHQLPQTPETLWLRLLGKGRVQERAIRELEALPRENRLRENVIRLVRELVTLLAKRQSREQDLDPTDKELIMTLTQMYEEAIAELRQQIQEELRPQIQEELRPQIQEELRPQIQEELRSQIQEELRPQIQAEALQQGKEEGVQVGAKQATLRLINNLLQVRFGAIDEELARIVEAIASLPSEEIAPLLLQLPREELLARFPMGEEKE
ncbi:MAG: hypothetical protein AAGA60_08670 [Cyanobacteria bacterium P01_E01_bin.42]